MLNPKSKIISIILIASLMNFGAETNLGFAASAKTRSRGRIKASGTTRKARSTKVTVSGLTAKKAALVRDRERLEAAIRGREAEAAAKARAMGAVDGKLDQTRAEISQIDASIKQTDETLRELEEKIEAGYERIGKQLLVADESTEVPFVNIITGAESWDNAVDNVDTFRDMSRLDKEEINSLSEVLNEYSEKKASLGTDLEGATKDNQQLVSEKERLIEDSASEREAIERLKRKYQLTEEQIKNVDNQKAALEEEMSRLQRSHISSDRYKKGRYSWPVPGHNHISSKYGMRWGRLHGGVDIPGPKGASIAAAADGVVIKVNSSNKWGSGYGYHLMIDHGNGYATLYAHCSKVVVSAGDHVKAGQKIAEVGNTGHSFGNHLHFETWKNGKRYNPATEGIG